MLSNVKMQSDICYVVQLCLLMSSARSSFLSVSHHGPHLSIGELVENCKGFFIILLIYSGGIEKIKKPFYQFVLKRFVNYLTTGIKTVLCLLHRCTP